MVLKRLGLAAVALWLALGFAGCGGGGNPRGIVAFWNFSGGSTSVVRDRVGNADLTIDDPANVTRDGDGLNIMTPTRLISTDTTRILEECQASNEITVEAWVSVAAGAPVELGPARIVGMTSDANTRNFMMGHEADRYTFRLRTADTDDNGSPDLESTAGALGRPEHVAYTRNTAGAEILFVNGARSSADQKTGTFDNWDANFPICVANECDLGRAFVGTIHTIGVYCRALSDEEIQKRFDMGF